MMANFNSASAQQSMHSQGCAGDRDETETSQLPTAA